jgi:hypothetical protein
MAHKPNRTKPNQTKPPQEATLKFNVDFTGLQVGDWVDVRCERNNVWYEARVILREGDQVKVDRLCVYEIVWERVLVYMPRD